VELIVDAYSLRMILNAYGKLPRRLN